MRHILIGTAAVVLLGLGVTDASAQKTPVPNASGSQVTNPDTYRATAYQNRALKPQPKMPWPTMSQKQTTKQKQATTKKRSVETTGSIRSKPAY